MRFMLPSKFSACLVLLVLALAAPQRVAAAPVSWTFSPPVAGRANDRAGRMLGTGAQPQNTFGWLDKLTGVALPEGGKSAHYYWPDGQLASIVAQGISAFTTPPPPESFLWDGLALIKRNDTLYLIEPHPSGGVPIASHPVGKPAEITYHLNDLLGTTLATVGPQGVHFSSLTSFGQPLKATAVDSPATTNGPVAPANPVPQPTRLPATK